jgi:hypothetical protein
MAKILVPWILGLLTAGTASYTITSGSQSRDEMLGFIAGLILGHLVAYCYSAVLTSRMSKYVLHYSFLFAFFGVLAGLAVISKQASFGYFEGFVMMVCLSLALIKAVRGVPH